MTDPLPATRSLWNPIDVGDIPLPHRLAMGPIGQHPSRPPAGRALSG
jgi:2,4-dienoyl-CoA reductase-like NADH-dependent reductase (Old Yellow Enzyme family)